LKKQTSKRPVNIFYGHMALGVVFIVIVTWGITQYIAHLLGYQSQLGRPLFIISGYPVYAPWSWAVWDIRYNHCAPKIFGRALLITYISFFSMFFLMLILAVFRMRNGKRSGAYGTARWAGTNELKRFGLFADAGVVLAQSNDARFHATVDRENRVRWIMDKPGRTLLQHNGPEHVFCFAPTGSGKDVGLVIPSLLSWTGSALVYDIKKELWASTSGWRRQFSHCWRFEPTAVDNWVHYNPLMEIRRGNFEVRDAQTIADILVDPDGSKERLDHWEKTGHNLLVGTILHVMYCEYQKNLAGVANFLSNPERPIYDTLTYMLSCKHCNGMPHPVVAACAREMLNKSENELSGVVSTAMSFLGLYRDPIIAQNTSYSDFSINDLTNAERPVSLYLVIPPSDIDRTKPLVRLLFNQFGRRLTEKMEFENRSPDSRLTHLIKKNLFRSQPKIAHRHKLLFMLNEFTSLGRLGFFETEMAYLRGYGIKCFIICQSLNQLDIYGQNNSILDNCHIRVTYGSLDDRTAKRISELLGQATELRRQLNYAGNRLSPWLGHVMASEQENPRPLLTPGEVLQLPGDDALVMVGGMPPYRAKKVMYYQDVRFKSRAWISPPDSEEEQKAELLCKRTLSSHWTANDSTKNSAEPSLVYSDKWDDFFAPVSNPESSGPDNGPVTAGPAHQSHGITKELQLEGADQVDADSPVEVDQSVDGNNDSNAGRDDHGRISSKRLQQRAQAVEIGDLPL
jgi:type IV secretion system protein VirD4